MFVVGIKGEDGKVEWQFQSMDYFQLIKLFPTAKFYISPDDVSEFCKKMSIPPGVYLAKYMKVKTKFYQDNPSSKPSASILPVSAVFQKQPLDKEKSTSSMSLNNMMPERAPAISNWFILRNYVHRSRPLLSIDKQFKAPAA